MKAQTDPPPDKPAADRSADSAATAQDARPVSAEERARVIKGLCGRHYSGDTAVDARIADEIRAAEAAAEAWVRASSSAGPALVGLLKNLAAEMLGVMLGAAEDLKVTRPTESGALRDCAAEYETRLRALAALEAAVAGEKVEGES